MQPLGYVNRHLSQDSLGSPACDPMQPLGYACHAAQRDHVTCPARRNRAVPSLLGVLPLLAILHMALLVGTPPSAQGQSVGRTSFVDKNAGIRLFLPAKWVEEERSALPGLVAAFKHPSGARLILSTRERRLDDTASALAAKHVEPLRRQGWTVSPPAVTQLGPESAVLLEAANRSSKKRVFQIYAVRGKLAYVLTLAGPEKHRVRLETDLRFIQKTTRFAM